MKLSELVRGLAAVSGDLGIGPRGLRRSSRLAPRRAGRPVRRLERARSTTAPPSPPKRSTAARWRCSPTASAGRTSRATRALARRRRRRARCSASSPRGSTASRSGARARSASPAPTASRPWSSWWPRCSTPPGRPAGRIGTLGYRFPGLAVHGRRPHQPRGVGPLPPARRDARARRARGGDRGLLARARPGTGRGRALRRRGLHQPDARPPRLPSRLRGVLRGQARLFDQLKPAGRAVVSRSTIRTARGCSRGCPAP